MTVALPLLLLAVTLIFVAGVIALAVEDWKAGR